MFWLIDRIFNDDRLREYYVLHISRHVKTVLKMVHALVILASLLFLAGSLCDLGFILEKSHLGAVVDSVSGITYAAFLLDRIMYLLLAPQLLVKRYRFIGHLVNFALLLSLFLPEGPGLQHVLLLCLSVMDLSNWFVGMLGRRINPSLIISLSFLLIITLGTVLLMAPKSLVMPNSLSVTDAVFVSTSAVCVTGLSPVDVSSVFTERGQMILLILIQVGGLGIMTITSFFALLMMGNTSVFNQLAVKDMVSGNSLSTLLSTLLDIIGFTFFIEALGALFIWFTLGNAIPQQDPLFFCFFHSVSAFCNAGFSTLPDGLSNSQLLAGHFNGFYLVISALIILGSIGYPLLVNLKESILYSLKWLLVEHTGSFSYRKTHLLGVNTKMVSAATLFLLVAGTASIAVLEWHNAFLGMPVADRLTQSFFNAVCPRTAGFSSIPLTQFRFQSLLIYTVLMWIGGAAQSTAGGIKVNVISIAVMNFWSTLRGLPNMILYKRRVSALSIRRANATVMVSLICIFLAYLVLTWMEPGLSKWGLFFEVVSAISTVGSSLSITGNLHEYSKILVAVLMFVGRVGLFTLLMSFIPQHTGRTLQYPEEEILIG